jgi:hypothetical protein
MVLSLYTLYFTKYHTKYDLIPYLIPLNIRDKLINYKVPQKAS